MIAITLQIDDSMEYRNNMDIWGVEKNGVKGESEQSGEKFNAQAHVAGKGTALLGTLAAQKFPIFWF